jgi:predicted AlkP superfamily phosphohydrolase/phosphomutase
MVALDACDIGTMTELAHRGGAPTFKRLQEAGARARVRTPPGVFEGAVWPSFSTARSPVRHGLYAPLQLVSGTYDFRQTYPHDAEGDPFWCQLARAGQRVAVIDVPLSYLTPDLNGLQVVEWGGEHYSGYRTWPPELAGQLVERFGVHPVASFEIDVDVPYSPDDVIHRSAPPNRTPEEACALLDGLLDGIARKTRLSIELLGEGDWDLFLVNFAEAHMVGHQLWHLHDRAHPDFDEDAQVIVGDPVARVYSALDRALGQHLEAVGPDANVLVLASHGMGPHYDGCHLLDRVLVRLERAAELEALRRPSTRLLVAGWSRLPRALRARAMPALARAVRRRRTRIGAPRDEDPDSIDRSTRRWFQAPNNFKIGAVWLNLAGREPAGRVPAAEYDDACAWLAGELLQVVNVDTGEPAVQQVWRCDDLYGPEGRDVLPDLFVEWNVRRPIEAVYSPTIGIVRSSEPGWRTGVHREDGELIAWGPGIGPGMVGWIGTQDIAPTIAAALGVTLDDVDGRPSSALADLLLNSAIAPAP